MNKFDKLFNLIMEATIATNLNKSKLKYDELIDQQTKLQANNKTLKETAETLKAEILALHPELTKNMDKAFTKLKDAWQLDKLLKIKANDLKYADIMGEYRSSW
jgi:cell division protein FtsB